MNPICWLTRRRLGAYRDGEIGLAARARTAAHLERCRRCTAELAILARLQAVLRVPAPELPEPVWEAFWPQVRNRLAASPVPERSWRRLWGSVGGHPRLVVGSALAAAALAVLAVFGPWQGVGKRPVTPPPSGQAGRGGPAAPVASAVPEQVMVQSVETGDPKSSVMVFANPETDATVVWVFGLQQTDI